jgi:molecular chaperone DnaJ
VASQDWFDKDFYSVLGVSKDVSESELKKKYRKLARQYHPDSNAGDVKAEAKFKEISEAYSVLSDPEQRTEYDQVRAMGSGARFTSGGSGQPGGFEDVFGGMFGGGGGNRRAGVQQGGFEDLLGGMFGGGGFGQTTGGYRGYGGPTRGRDLEASTTLDFVTAINGDTITLQPQGGKSIRVKIPAGVSDGQKIRLTGKGEPSPDGGETGNLVLTVKVRKHPVFERDGLNLRVDVPVTFVEATLGATVEVPTLGGDPVRPGAAREGPRGRDIQGHGRPARDRAGCRPQPSQRRGEEAPRGVCEVDAG